MTSESVIRRFGLAALSGFLLTLAFPRWNLWLLAWGALVPLLHSLEQAKNRREAFLLGFTAGFVFFLLSISWLRHVTWFGLFFVAAICAAYWGVFGVIGRGLCEAAEGGRSNLPPGVILSPPKADEACLPDRQGSRRSFASLRTTSGTPPRNDGAHWLLLAAAWTALEFIRTEIPVWGFGWNLLGYSQAPNLWVSQLASLGGVYSVSFLVFLGNAVVYSVLKTGTVLSRHKENRPWFSWFWFPAVFLLLVGAVSFYGSHRIQTFVPHSMFRISVLQGNIPQLLKWDAAYKEEILRVYLNLTELASYDGPQLIVWPEAAYPGFFNRDLDAERVKALVQKVQVPLLVGGPHQEEDGYFNSAYLLNLSGEIAQRYDKIRLVPFGETVPWKPVFGFLEPLAYSLGVSDFSSGREPTVFEIPLTLPSPPEGERESLPAGQAGVRGVRPRFSVLICFEDTFPELARRLVDRGAEFLTVVTNDAWFGRSSAPYQHLQASVFRAIENGVSVVRAANTGVSGFITPRGEVVGRVQNKEGKDTFIMGGMTYPAALTPEITLYRRGGWAFPWACLVVLGLTSLRGSVSKRGRSNLGLGIASSALRASSQ